MTDEDLSPQPALLTGALVHLEPLGSEHAPLLFESVRDPEVWRWKLVAMPESIVDLERLIAEVMTGPGRWPFVIRRRSDGLVIGSTTVAKFDVRHGVAENGFTWLARAQWGQRYNEDTKLTLLGHLFDHLDLARVEWQVDAQNERSFAALLRLGLTLEGRHRSRHLRPDGTRRDSLVFGLIRDDWPEVRARLHALVGEARG